VGGEFLKLGININEEDIGNLENPTGKITRYKGELQILGIAQLM